MNIMPATSKLQPVRPQTAAYGHTTARQSGAVASVLHDRFTANGTKDTHTDLLEEYVREKSDDRPYLILHGDAFDLIDQLPADSIDLAITSRPYWGLRTYDLDHNWDIIKLWKADGHPVEEVPPYDCLVRRGRKTHLLFEIQMGSPEVAHDKIDCMNPCSACWTSALLLICRNQRVNRRRARKLLFIWLSHHWAPGRPPQGCSAAMREHRRHPRA